MKLKELKARIDKILLIKGTDELDVLVKIGDPVLFPEPPNPHKDDHFYNLNDICVSALGRK